VVPVVVAGVVGGCWRYVVLVLDRRHCIRRERPKETELAVVGMQSTVLNITVSRRELKATEETTHRKR